MHLYIYIYAYIYIYMYMHIIYIWKYVCVRIIYIYICTHVRLHEQYMVTLSMNDLYTNEQGKPVKKLTKMPSKTCTCDLHPNTGIRRTKFNLITLGSNSCLLGGRPKSIIKHIYIYSIYDSIYNYIYIYPPTPADARGSALGNNTFDSCFGLQN